MLEKHHEIQSRRKTIWRREIRKEISKHFKILLNHITYIIKFSSAIWHKQQVKFRATKTKVFIPNITTKHVATNTYIRPITTFFLSYIIARKSRTKMRFRPRTFAYSILTVKAYFNFLKHRGSQSWNLNTDNS